MEQRVMLGLSSDLCASQKVQTYTTKCDLVVVGILEEARGLVSHSATI